MSSQQLFMTVNKIFNWSQPQPQPQSQLQSLNNKNQFILKFYSYKTKELIIQKKIQGVYSLNNMFLNVGLNVGYTQDQKQIIVKIQYLGQDICEINVDLKKLAQKRVQYFSFADKDKVLQINVTDYNPYVNLNQMNVKLQQGRNNNQTNSNSKNSDFKQKQRQQQRQRQSITNKIRQKRKQSSLDNQHTVQMMSSHEQFLKQRQLFLQNSFANQQNLKRNFSQNVYRLMNDMNTPKSSARKYHYNKNYFQSDSNNHRRGNQYQEQNNNNDEYYQLENYQDRYQKRSNSNYHNKNPSLKIMPKNNQNNYYPRNNYENRNFNINRHHHNNNYYHYYQHHINNPYIREIRDQYEFKNYQHQPYFHHNNRNVYFPKQQILYTNDYGFDGHKQIQRQRQRQRQYYQNKNRPKKFTKTTSQKVFSYKNLNNINSNTNLNNLLPVTHFQDYPQNQSKNLHLNLNTPRNNNYISTYHKQHSDYQQKQRYDANSKDGRSSTSSHHNKLILNTLNVVSQQQLGSKTGPTNNNNNKNKNNYNNKFFSNTERQRFSNNYYDQTNFKSKGNYFNTHKYQKNFNHQQQHTNNNNKNQDPFGINKIVNNHALPYNKQKRTKTTYQEQTIVNSQQRQLIDEKKKLFEEHAQYYKILSNKQIKNQKKKQ